MTASQNNTRILFVIATLDRAGAEGQLVSLCLGLPERGFEPAVCCLTRGGELARELEAADIPVWVLGKSGKLDFSAIGRLRRRIREFQPEIVHTWLFTSNAFGRVAAWLSGVPILVASERAADIWKTWVHRSIDRLLGRVTARVIVNADAVRRFCTEKIRLPPDRVVVIRNGIDLAAFDRAASREPSPPLPSAKEGLRIGTVGRLARQKGIPYLLEAFRRLLASAPGSRLCIVGDGEDRGELESLVERLGIRASVDFLGHRADVPAILPRLDVLVLSSLWEGLPNAVIEAMAASRPVVATAVDGTLELVEDGVTGWLVPPRSPEALAGKIEELLNDPDMRERMGREGRQRIERDYGLDRMLDETAALYDQLIEERQHS